MLALARLHALLIATIGSLAPAQVRMDFDNYNMGRLAIPSGTHSSNPFLSNRNGPVDPIPTYTLAAYNGNDPTLWDAFDTWLGRPADMQLAFFNQSSWSAYDSSIAYATGLFGSRRTIWSVPLTAENGSLPTVVAGFHDSTFTNVATSILAKQPGTHPIFIRLGWEFNLLLNPSRAFDNSSTPVATPATWVSAYQRVVGLFRAQSNRFRFAWVPSLGEMTANGLTITDCYPGDTYVDVIGGDLYWDSRYASIGSDAGASGFGYHKTQSAGLDWLKGFAATHTKPWGLFEWGVDNNGATGWMQGISSYMRTNGAAFNVYWNSNEAFSGKLSDGQYPANGAIYRATFGRPVITSATNFVTATGSSFNVSLTANQTATWSIVSGKDATLSDSILTFASQAAGVTGSVVVRATNGDGLASTSDQTVSVSFAAAYSFTNTEAQAVASRMTNPPTEARKKLIDDFYTAIKPSILAKADLIAFRAAADEQAALMNWVSASYGTTTKVGSPLFTVDRGFTGVGSPVGYLNTGLAINRSSNNFSVNSATIAVWPLNTVDSSSPIIGTENGNVAIMPNRKFISASIIDYRLIIAPVRSIFGLATIVRNGASARQLYKDDAQILSDTQIGSALNGDAILELTQNTTYPSARQNAFTFVGGALTAAEVATLYNAVRAYLVGVGAAQ